MARAREMFIVGRGKLWMISSRPDLLELPQSHLWSQYAWDAKKFDNRAEAKRKARKVGGAVYSFNMANGKTELLKQKIPEGAVCDTCRGYRPWNGVCNNPESEYYGTNVSYQDVCEDWGGKASG